VNLQNYSRCILLTPGLDIRSLRKSPSRELGIIKNHKMKRFILSLLAVGSLVLTSSQTEASSAFMYVSSWGYSGVTPQTFQVSASGGVSNFLNNYIVNGVDVYGNDYAQGPYNYQIVNGAWQNTGNTQFNSISTNGQISVFSTNSPNGFANDFQGNSYFNYSGTFYKLNASGGLTQLFTSTYQGPIAYHPNGYFVGFQGNLVKIDMTGAVQTINLTANYGFSQNFAVDILGNIYIDNPSFGGVWKIGSDLNPVFINSGNFVGPSGMAADAFGNVYITDWYYNDVVKIDSNGKQTIFASNLNHPSSVLISPPPLLSIAAQPQNVQLTAANSQNASFSIIATNGIPPYSYQWKQFGVNIPNQTNSTLTVTNAIANNVGIYSCVITDSQNNTIASTNVTLTISGVSFNLWQGLVAYYPLQTNAQDLGTNSLNCVSINNSTLAQSPFIVTNPPAYFDGSYTLESTNAFPITGNQPRTISVWVNCSSLSGGQQLVYWGSLGGGSLSGMTLNKDSATLARIVLHGDGCDAHSLSFPFNYFQWVNLVITYPGDVTRACFYVNGVQIPNDWQDTSTGISLNTPTGSLLSIGRNSAIQINTNDGWMTPFVGEMQNVKIYNRALSSSEVSSLYNLDIPSYIGDLVTGLASYFPFNGNLNDATGALPAASNSGSFFQSDRFGNSNGAIGFSGSQYALITGLGSVLSGSVSGVTVSGWYYLNQGSACSGFIQNPTGQPGPAIRFDFGVIQGDLGGWNGYQGQGDFVTTATFPTGSWHQLIGVMPVGSLPQYFLDGVPCSWGSPAPQNPIQPLTFDCNYGVGTSWEAGHPSLATGYFLNGAISNLRFYNRALTTNEIATLYNLESTPVTYATNGSNVSVVYYNLGGTAVIPSTNNGLPVTSIGDGAFQFNANLTSVVIPTGITNIGNSAFAGCYGMTNVSIPSSVVTIGANAFSGCSLLSNVSIPPSVTSIGANTFNGCLGLTNLVIPPGVTSIGQNAFAGCSNLTSITLPNSIISIGQNAFSNCPNLTTVTASDDLMRYINQNQTALGLNQQAVSDFVPPTLSTYLPLLISGLLSNNSFVSGLAISQTFLTPMSGQILATSNNYGLATKSDITTIANSQAISLSNAISNTLVQVSGVSNSLSGSFASNNAILSNALAALISNQGSNFSNSLSGASNTLTGLINSNSLSLSNVLSGAISNKVTSLSNALSTSFTTQTAGVSNALSTSLTIQGSSFSNAVSNTLVTLNSVSNALSGSIATNSSSLSNVLTTSIANQGSSFSNALTAASNVLATSLVTQGSSLSNALATASNVLSTSISVQTAGVSNALVSILASQGSSLSNAVSNALVTVSGVSNTLSNLITSNSLTLSNALTASITSQGSALSNSLVGASNALAETINSNTLALSNVLSLGITTQTAGVSNALASSLAIQGASLSNAVSNVLVAVSGVSNALSSSIASSAASASSQIASASNALSYALQNNAALFSSALSNAISQLAAQTSPTNPAFISAIASQILSASNNDGLAVKQSQSLNFPAIPAQTITPTSSLTLNVISSANQTPIIFTSGNTAVATVSNNILKLLGSGSTTITASQAGNSLYNPVTATQPLVVNLGMQTIKFPSIPTQTFATNATYTIKSTSTAGLSNSYFIGNGAIGTISNNVLLLLGTGSTTITATNSGNAYFGPASATQTLIVK